jgi:hypothetical protein
MASITFWPLLQSPSMEKDAPRDQNREVKSPSMATFKEPLLLLVL